MLTRGGRTWNRENRAQPRRLRARAGLPGGAGRGLQAPRPALRASAGGERTGFARMGIAAGCPIVPFGAVGAEDRFQVLLDTDQRVAALVRALIRKVAGRNDVGTLLVAADRPLGCPAGPALTSASAHPSRPRPGPAAPMTSGGARRTPRSRQGRGRGSHRGAAASLPRGRPSPQFSASRQDHPQRAARLFDELSATSAMKRSVVSPSSRASSSIGRPAAGNARGPGRGRPGRLARQGVDASGSTTSSRPTPKLFLCNQPESKDATGRCRRTGRQGGRGGQRTAPASASTIRQRSSLSPTGR